MKSKNHLIITGFVQSDVTPTPEQSLIRFRIFHNFGGGRKPLFLNCCQIIPPGTAPLTLRKGDVVKLRAYLRMHAETIEAVVKSMEIEQQDRV